MSSRTKVPSGRHRAKLSAMNPPRTVPGCLRLHRVEPDLAPEGFQARSPHPSRRPFDQHIALACAVHDHKCPFPRGVEERDPPRPATLGQE
jgi:hypothetical protein